MAPMIINSLPDEVLLNILHYITLLPPSTCIRKLAESCICPPQLERPARSTQISTQELGEDKRKKSKESDTQTDTFATTPPEGLLLDPSILAIHPTSCTRNPTILPPPASSSPPSQSVCTTLLLHPVHTASHVCRKWRAILQPFTITIPSTPPTVTPTSVSSHGPTQASPQLSPRASSHASLQMASSSFSPMSNELQSWMPKLYTKVHWSIATYDGPWEAGDKIKYDLAKCWGAGFYREQGGFVLFLPVDELSGDGGMENGDMRMAGKWDREEWFRRLREKRAEMIRDGGAFRSDWLPGLL